MGQQVGGTMSWRNRIAKTLFLSLAAGWLSGCSYFLARQVNRALPPVDPSAEQAAAIQEALTGVQSLSSPDAYVGIADRELNETVAPFLKQQVQGLDEIKLELRNRKCWQRCSSTACSHWPDSREAIRTAEPESLLLLCAATNRVLGYFVSGQPQLAYREICRLRARFGDGWLESLPRLLQMRQTWLEGQVRNALGMEEEAIGLLKKARESFIRADRGYEVCYTSIDLALTYATQRRFAEVQHELAFALPFCSDEPTIERFGKEAVQLLLRTLVRQGRLDVELIRAVSSRLYDIGRAPLRVFPHSPLAELRI